MPRFLRITYFEDNPNDVLLLETFLNESGIQYSLNVLQDGEAAIGYVEQLAKQEEVLPDLFFLDLNLPRRNGYEVLQAVRSYPVLDQLQVIILTTSDNPQDRNRAMSSGANCFLTKPPEFQNLNTMLELVEAAWMNIAYLTVENETSDQSPDAIGAIDPLESIKGIDSILLIEDNPDDVRYIREILESSMGALTIAAVESVDDAIKLLRNQNFSAILADLHLPDATGLEALERLIRTGTEVPIVILTGLDDEETGTLAVEKGAQDYLVKGNFDGLSLRHSIKYAVTRGRAAQLARRNITSHGAVLQELLENSPVGLANFDTKLKMVNCNSEFRKQLAHSAFDIDSIPSMQSIFVNVPPQLWMDTIDSGNPFAIEKVRFTDRDDRQFWLAVWSVRDRMNAITGGVLTTTEVTSQIARDNQRDEFFAALAHDIKNPLVGSNAVLSAVMNGALGDLEPKQKETLSLLKASNDSLLSMLRNLVDVYRFASDNGLQEFEKVNLTESVAEALSTHAPLAVSKNVKFDLIFPSESCFVMGDPEAIYRLCSNLLDNAIKFSHSDSTVVVEVNSEQDGFNSIKVIDRGLGMTPEEQKVLFTRGHGSRRPMKPGSGTGLGLFLCKKVVNGHQGHIICKSEIDVGTTFEVLFPALVPTTAGQDL